MEAVGNLPPEALQEEVEPFFIPFPGTTKEIKPKPYRGSDPEWQEFVKFSKDQDLGKRVRGGWFHILGQNFNVDILQRNLHSSSGQSPRSIQC